MLATPDLLREAALPWRLGQALPRWLEQIPLYRQRRPAPHLAGPAVSLEELRRLPLVTKQDIRREFPHNFLQPGQALEDLLETETVELEHTSGTSEERTPLLLGRGWWTEQEQRALRLNPFVASVLDEFPQARRVTLSSPVCNGDICYTGVPSRDERKVGQTLYASLSRFPFLWSESDLARIAQETADWAPQFLDVDPVYGVVFALHCERRGLRLPSLRFVLCSYEFVSVAHRRIIERGLGVPVFNLYGSTETGHLLMETALDDLRPSYETAFLEVLNPDAQEVGALAVTTLTNDFMPLIRYHIGDLVERHELPYYTTFKVHGRLADAFPRPDGTRLTTRQVDQCFADLAGVAHYQLTERVPGDFLLRYVADGSGPEADGLSVLQGDLGQLLGQSAPLAIEKADFLMPESSGKFRLGYPARRNEE